jgi:hypothetical protein
MAGNTTATTSSQVSLQGSIFEGGNPSHYDTKNPIVLFIIQVLGLTRDLIERELIQSRR